MTRLQRLVHLVLWVAISVLLTAGLAAALHARRVKLELSAVSGPAPAGVEPVAEGGRA